MVVVLDNVDDLSLLFCLYFSIDVFVRQLLVVLTEIMLVFH